MITIANGRPSSGGPYGPARMTPYRTHRTDGYVIDGVTLRSIWGRFIQRNEAASIRAGSFWWMLAVTEEVPNAYVHVALISHNGKNLYAVRPITVPLGITASERIGVIAEKMEDCVEPLALPPAEMTIRPELDGLAYIPGIGYVFASTLFPSFVRERGEDRQ